MGPKDVRRMGRKQVFRFYKNWKRFYRHYAKAIEDTEPFEVLQDTFTGFYEMLDHNETPPLSPSYFTEYSWVAELSRVTEYPAFHYLGDVLERTRQNGYRVTAPDKEYLRALTEGSPELYTVPLKEAYRIHWHVLCRFIQLLWCRNLKRRIRELGLTGNSYQAEIKAVYALMLVLNTLIAGALDHEVKLVEPKEKKVENNVD